MTLPFRLRHHDSESSHDRARALVSEGFGGPLRQDDAAWLDDHLARCAECRVERDAYVADRELLRGLRDRMPEPPRDLWARTATAIEAEALRRHGGRAGLGRSRPALSSRGLPLGVMAAALVVLVVVGTALLPRGFEPITQPTTPGQSAVAVATPGATALVPVADRVAWVQRAADGSYSLVFADVDHACPASDPTCAPLADSSPAPLALAAPPQAVVLSPHNDQIAVVGSATGQGGSVLIVTVPTPRPTASAGPSPATTPAKTVTPPPATVTPGGSSRPAGEPRVIISGVTVVGPVGFSQNGEWVAFSARPNDGSSGPDLYLWHAGDASARRVTTDGASFFSGWYGDLMLASGIVPQAPGPTGSAEPNGSGEPTSEPSQQPTISAEPETPGSSSASSPATTPEPSAPAEALEAHPYSFLLDPMTGVREDFALSDVWLPSIDPTGRFVTYWAGTVAPADPTAAFASGHVDAWRPATGHLVLDGWSEALTPLPSASSSPTESAPGEAPSTSTPSSSPPSSEHPKKPKPSNGPASAPSPTTMTIEPASPSAAPSAVPTGPLPSLATGPTGTPIELAAGPVADFDARFDPSGLRLAIWILDAPESSAGRLWLVVLDPVAGSIDSSLQPMSAPGVQALRGFTIDTGRLAWATPAGQDGQPSSVQVLAWKGDEFGQVQSVPGGNPQIVR